MISILNYGLGNLASIQNMLKKVRVESAIIDQPSAVENATALIIPGVGKFDHAMKQIDALGFREPLEFVAKKRRIPILGICLGMQLMTRGSEEGSLPGLGWMEAQTRYIRSRTQEIRVPHMGWNLIQIQKNHPCFDNDGLQEHRFYFVHSYAVHCQNPKDVLATTHYGDEFVCAFAKDNFLGVQFHPEKSHKFGASFLRRFAEDYVYA